MYKYLFLVFTLFIFSCGEDDEMADPCAGVSCLNGSDCVNGDCVCALGYQGVDCANERTPSSLLIRSITVTTWPIREPGGDDWDFDGTGPDLKLQIVDENAAIVTEVSEVAQDAIAGQQYQFEGISILINNPTTFTYFIRLLDRDTGLAAPDDVMGSLGGIFYTTGQGFPAVLNIDNNGPVAFDLVVEYQF